MRERSGGPMELKKKKENHKTKAGRESLEWELFE